MDIEPLPDSSTAPPLTPPPPEGLPSKIFLYDGGLRAGWRLLIYAAFAAAIAFGGQFVLRQFVRPSRGVFSPGYLLIQEAFSFVVIFAAALLMAQIERRSAGVYGLPLRGAFGKLFWQGCLIGLVEVSALVGLIAAFGGYSFGGLAVHGGQLLRWAMLWAVFFLVVGLFEEFAFRGYAQFALTQGAGFWWASIATSLTFGAVHITNPGETWVGITGVVLTGLFWCFTLRRTGSLWFAVGMHAAFDFGETFLYSVPDSGMTFPGHLSSATLAGPAWLAGGTAGPEASILDFAVLLLFFYVFHLLFPLRSENLAALEEPVSNG